MQDLNESDNDHTNNMNKGWDNQSNERLKVKCMQRLKKIHIWKSVGKL